MTISTQQKSTYDNVHSSFKLNGFALSKEDLIRQACIFIKEGDDFEKVVGDFIYEWFDDNDYIELSTSGTTGTPKIIRLNKQAMVNSALATGTFFDLRPGNKVLHCLPVRFIAGKMQLVRGFVLGLDMDFVAPTSHPLQNNDTIYDFAAMVPLQVMGSIDKLCNIKKIIIGGQKISKPLEDILLKLPIEAYETYGMTETITHIAAKKVGENSFKVLPNVKVSKDQNNCLCISADLISTETLCTNDIVEIISDQEFIFLGRLDNIVNSGGIKLIPESIEAKLANQIKARFFVIGIEDELLGEKLALVIEGDRYEIDANDFENLDKYQKPKEIFFYPQFLETGSGKIRRRETLAMVLEQQ